MKKVIDLFHELKKIADPLNASFGAPENEDEDHWISYPLFYDDINVSREIFVFVFIENEDHDREEDVVVIQARVGKVKPSVSWNAMLTDAYFSTFSRFVVIAGPVDDPEIFIQASLPLSFWNADLFRKMLEEVAINADYWAFELEGLDNPSLN